MNDLKVIVRNTVPIYTTKNGIKYVWTRNTTLIPPIGREFLLDNFDVALRDNNDNYLTT